MIMQNLMMLGTMAKIKLRNFFSDGLLFFSSLFIWEMLFL